MDFETRIDSIESSLMKPSEQPRIIFEDNHLLVVDKPADVATMGLEAGQSSMVKLAAQYLKEKYNKPGNVFVGVVSRLDQRVSGVLVFARTSKAASRLSQQIRDRQVSKRYLAWVEGRLQVAPEQDWIEVQHWLNKNETRQRMEVVTRDSREAKHARLRMRLLAVWKNTSLVEIDLITGRKHQIRVQLAEVGHPVLGDKKYGASRPFSKGIALHCFRICLLHPTRKEPMKFEVSPVKHWPNLPPALRDALP